MDKPTFTTHLKRAQDSQGPYKITGSRRDVLYEDLCNESDEDVIAALKSIGKTNEVINYANIMRYVGENKKNREWGNRNKQKPEPPMEGSPAPKYENMPPEVQKTIDSFRDKWKW